MCARVVGVQEGGTEQDQDRWSSKQAAGNEYLPVSRLQLEIKLDAR